jgi:hypothetical protein
MNTKTFYDTARVSDNTGIYDLPLISIIDIYDDTIDLDNLTIIDSLSLTDELEIIK